MVIKKVIKRFLPGWLIVCLKDFIFLFQLFFEYMYDFLSYVKFNAHKDTLDVSHLEGRIIAHYHVIEKGLSHYSPKKNFSEGVVDKLMKLIVLYENKNNGVRSSQVDVAICVLSKYFDYHAGSDSQNVSLYEKFLPLFKNVECSDCGLIRFDKKSFLKDQFGSFEEFALSRYSLRDFEESDVSLDLIERAVRIAQKSPSVCNRQTCKVHVITQRTDIDNHLIFQNGNRGFGGKINKLIIVTSDLKLFEGVREKNQCFIDGGIFSMSLLYALHYLGLGAVTLNWAYEKSQDLRIRKLNTVPDNERIILMIGVGNIPNEFSLACSKRKPLDEVISIK